jgi:hypothetical protein
MMIDAPALTDFFDPSSERLEHIVASDALTAIEAKGVFVQVHLQILALTLW